MVNMRLEPFLLLQLLTGYALASVCFVMGIELGAWQFWVSFATAAGAAFYFSRKAGLWMLALNALVFALTLYTFSYVHIDASICHLPMSHFMQDGWNPVRESSIEAVRSRFAARGLGDVQLFSILHVIAGPKFSQILAAQMQSASGLFSAGGYPLWTMCLALAFVAFRFATLVWRLPRLVAVAFAVLVTSNYIIAENSFFGLVDYVTYSSIAIAALSLATWSQTRDRIDLAVFFAGLVIALTGKFNSIIPVGVLLLLAAYLGRKDKSMRRGILVFLASLSVLAIIPYWTSAWCHGSPVYPAHSFRSDVPLMDLTDDFIGNDDACKMGYMARMVYAWVSRALAEWGCRLWNSFDSFAPEWKYDFITKGENAFFCTFFWLGALLSLFVNRNRVTLVAWALMAAFFLLPVKYIGYSRYVSFVFCVTVVFWFNVLSAAPERARRVLYAASVVFAVAMAHHCVKMYLRQLRAEGIRQINIERIANSGGYAYSESPSHWDYLFKNRLPLQGAAVHRRGAYEIIMDWPFVLTGHGLLDRDESVWWSREDRFPSPVYSSPRVKKGGAE